MANIEARGGGWRLKWRLGGRRDGAPQSLTFLPPPGDDPAATYQDVLAAKAIVEARLHGMTREQLRRALWGDADAVRPLGIPTFGEWVRMWETDRRKTDDVQKDTLDRYVQVLEQRAMPMLRHLHLTEITQDTIRDWVAFMRDKQRAHRTAKNPEGRPLSPQTIRRAHAILHQCLSQAVPRYLPANPAARVGGSSRHAVGLPKVTVHEAVFLEPWEIDRVLSNCSDRIHDLAFTLVRTGLRLGEVVVLRREDVVLNGKKPHIKVRRALKPDGLIGPPKTAKSRREVTISPELVEVLAARASGKASGGLLFPAPHAGKVRRKGDPPARDVWEPNNLRMRYWLPAVAAAQRCEAHPPPAPEKPARGPVRSLRIDEVSTCTCDGRLTRIPRLHDLRHTHVSLLVEAGWLPKRVQLRVGHASFKITMDVYGHLWDLGDDDRLSAMERLLATAADEAA